MPKSTSSSAAQKHTETPLTVSSSTLSDSSKPSILPEDLPFNIAEPYPYTFTQIIDADHFTIQRLAAQIRRLIASNSSSLESPSSPISRSSPTVQATPSKPAPITSILSTLRPLLLETTWRLIRHDFSEDVVMRPAFASILGANGQEMSEHDRADHAAGRAQLLSIVAKLADLEGNLPSPSQSVPIDNASKEDFIRTNLDDLFSSITTTFDSLQTHMEVESGSFLPGFEALINKDMSTQLARQYVATMFMTPYLTVGLPSNSSSSSTYTSVASAPASPSLNPRSKPKSTSIFSNGVETYLSTDLSTMTQIYYNIVSSASRSEVVAAELSSDIDKEIMRLQVGKWVGLHERKGNTEAQSKTRRRLGVGESNHAAADTELSNKRLTEEDRRLNGSKEAGRGEAKRGNL